MKFLIISVLLFLPFTSKANDLSYKDRSNAGETKFERIEKLEGYLSKLSSNIGTLHKKMEKDFDKKLKDLEKKLKEEWKSDVSKLEKAIENSKVSDYVKKEETNSIQAQVDLFNNKIIELKEKIEKLNLEVSTLKEISQ
ncbi:MAG: hypothetical protein CME70_15895 [Halobacteriovorax sp.]|nr:hypothetical protein [Halobacteriovorax sp.]